eukprot:jgi/Hompol1/2387/HPOL_001445-RA
MDKDMAAMMAAMGLPVGFGSAQKQSAAANSRQASTQQHQKPEPPTTAVVDKQAQDSNNSNNNDGDDNDDNDDNDDSDDQIGPQPAPQTSRGGLKASQGRDDDDDDDDEEDDDDELEEDDVQNDFEADTLPVSHQATLKDHSRTVSAISLDPSGARLITAGRDYTVKLWDFHGMSSSMRPFRSFEPYDGNPIRDVQFSTSGDQFLIAASTPQMRIYDRDGNKILEFPKGDPYLRDLKHTKGHVSALTCVRWHPVDKRVCASASLDSTVRIWDIQKTDRQKDVIYVRSKQSGGRTNVTSASYSHDGRQIACAGSDGALRIFNSNGPYLSPTHSLEGAHMQGAAVSSIVFSIDNNHLITRAMDDTLKLWDIRNFRKAVGIVNNISSNFEETNAIFSPNNRFILTCVSADKSAAQGSVAVFDRHSLEKVQDIPVTGSAVRVLWHAKLNQIFVGTSEGAVQTFYDPVMSLGGIKVPLARKPKKLAVDDYEVLLSRNTEVLGPIITPGAYMRGERPRNKRKVHEEEANRRRPENTMPVTGKGKGGRLGTSVAEHLLKSITKDTRRQEDPREAILKFADAAAADPYWVAPAYKSTQPQAVLSSSVYENELEKEIEERKKRRK